MLSMAIRYDLQLSNNDLLILNNDLVWGESDEQHIADTINACPGWWKENPTDGVAIMTFLKSTNASQILAKVTKLQLTSDGYDCRPLVTYDNTGKLNLNPNVSI